MKCSTNIVSNWLCKLLAPIVITSILATATWAQSVVPNAMRTALQGNAAKLGPLELTWERLRESDLSASDTLYRIKLHPMNAGELKPHKVLFRCDDGKYYSHTWRYAVVIDKMPVDGKIDDYLTGTDSDMRITEDEASFDGNVCYIGNSVELQEQDGGIPMLRKTPLEKASNAFADIHYFKPEYFTWAGYELPGTPTGLSESLRSRVLSDAEGEGVTSVATSEDDFDGVTFDLVEISTSTGTIQYLLDPSKEYAVCRRTEKTSDGKTVTDAICSDFIKLDHRDIWLPKTVRVDWHTWGTIPETVTTEPILAEVFNLLDWKSEPIPAEQFVLNYNVPGASIQDAVAAGAEKFEDGHVGYRVPAEPSDLDAVIDAATGKTIPPGKGYGSWLLYLNVVIILTIVGYFAVQKLR